MPAAPKPAADPAAAGATPPQRPVSALPNLGPAADEAFARAGIHSAEALIALGPDEAYLRLILSGSRPHFIGYYAMLMGLQGRPWNDCRGAEKAALRLRFDAIRARAAEQAATRGATGVGGHEKGRLPMEAALDLLGVRPPASARRP